MGIMELASKVKAANVEDYNSKFNIMAQEEAYEEELMAEAYYKAEQALGELYSTDVMLEPSVQNGHGRVDALRDGGMGEAIAHYSFEQETEDVWSIIKGWDGKDPEELIAAVAETIVNLVRLLAD